MQIAGSLGARSAASDDAARAVGFGLERFERLPYGFRCDTRAPELMADATVARATFGE